MPNYVDFEVQITPRTISERVQELGRELADLRPLFEQFSADFYKDTKRIYGTMRTRPNWKNYRFRDLSPKYKKRKKRISPYGKIYPIMFLTGRLVASLTSRQSRDSINIIKRDRFVIGTSVPYAIYHHSKQTPRRRLPRRILWDDDEKFEGGKSRMYQRWHRMIDKHFEKLAQGAFEGK